MRLEAQLRNGKWSLAAAVLFAFVCGGAACPMRQTISEFRPPIVFSNQPELPEIIAHVNKSLALVSLESNNLTISGPELPAKLRGSLQWNRPHNFRLEAYLGSRLVKAFAAGSNAETFWLSMHPDLYYAHHVDFDQHSGPRNILPVSPLWIREAMGVVEFASNFSHEPPIERPDGKLVVQSLFPSARGAYKRQIVIDSQTGVIEETRLHDHTGRLIAIAQQQEHQYYSGIDFSLPHRVDVQLIPDIGTPIAFTIEVGFYMINQSTDSPEQFQFPDSTGMNLHNLTQLNSSGQVTTTPPRYTPANRSAISRANNNLERRSLFR